jgi:hypothetical protein
MAIWPWYGGMVMGELYEAGEFLSVHNYQQVRRWADEVAKRPAVIRGRKVNRMRGKPEENDMGYADRDKYGMYRNRGSAGPGPALMGADTLIGDGVVNAASRKTWATSRKSCST